MATIVGALSALLSLNSKAFNRNAKKSTQALHSLGSAAKMVKGAIGLLGVGLGANALIGFGKRTTESVDALAKMSAKLEMSGAALKGFNLLADLSGTSSATVAKSLEYMQRTLGDFS